MESAFKKVRQYLDSRAIASGKVLSVKLNSDSFNYLFLPSAVWLLLCSSVFVPLFL